MRKPTASWTHLPGFVVLCTPFTLPEPTLQDFVRSGIRRVVQGQGCVLPRRAKPAPPDHVQGEGGLCVWGRSQGDQGARHSG